MFRPPVAQLDDASLALAEPREVLERTIQIVEADRLRAAHDDRRVQGHVRLAAAAFFGVSPPRVIDEHAAHRARRHRHEVGAALPAVLASREAQVDLVRERRGLQGVAGALPEIAGRQEPRL
jgi:hypothetical protein